MLALQESVAGVNQAPMPGRRRSVVPALSARRFRQAAPACRQRAPEPTVRERHRRAAVVLRPGKAVFGAHADIGRHFAAWAATFLPIPVRIQCVDAGRVQALAFATALFGQSRLDPGPWVTGDRKADERRASPGRQPGPHRWPRWPL